MIYKKRMHHAIQFFFFLVLSNAETVSHSGDRTEDPVKRFNLQDLLGQQGVQLNAGTNKQDAHVTTSKTQAIDVTELLAAAQKAAANQPQTSAVSKFVEPKKQLDIDITADKNGNLNLVDIPGLVSSTHNAFSISDLQALIKPKEPSIETLSYGTENNVVREEINLGKHKLELETAGKRATRYTLARGPDGGLNLVPLVDDDSGGRTYEFKQPKETEEKGRGRQQMQMTTMSQALYSPFPSDANILHLHLKGKDGKDGKSGNKGPMGPLGPKGPFGPKGLKGDAGTCSSQINGLFECTPDELDSLSNRVDYLEKICKKVENAAKKHNLIHSTISKPPSTSSSTTLGTSTKNDVVSKPEPSKQKEENATRELKVSSSIKERGSSESEKIQSTTTTAAATTSTTTKEKESSKEKEEIKEKENKEEETARLKEKATLKLETYIQENGITRAKKEELKEKEEKEKVKEKEDSKEEVPAANDKNIADEKDTEPIKKKNKDGSPPTERSMIDIKAKLKIAELDLMDRIKLAKPIH